MERGVSGVKEIGKGKSDPLPNPPWLKFLTHEKTQGGYNPKKVVYFSFFQVQTSKQSLWFSLFQAQKKLKTYMCFGAVAAQIPIYAIWGGHQTLLRGE